MGRAQRNPDVPRYPSSLSLRYPDDGFPLRSNGDLKPIDEWPAIWRQGLVAGVEVEALFEGSGEERVQVGFVKKIRLSDRLRRLELIGKHVGVNAFQNQVVINDVEGLADPLVRARQRMDSKV